MGQQSAMEIDDEFIYIATNSTLKKVSKNGLALVVEIRLGEGSSIGQPPIMRLDDRCAYVLQGSKLFQVAKASMTVVTVLDTNVRDQIR